MAFAKELHCRLAYFETLAASSKDSASILVYAEQCNAGIINKVCNITVPNVALQREWCDALMASTLPGADKEQLVAVLNSRYQELSVPSSGSAAGVPASAAISGSAAAPSGAGTAAVSDSVAGSNGSATDEPTKQDCQHFPNYPTFPEWEVILSPKC